MDLKLEYQTFKAKPSKSLSQTYTRYNNLLNELANDGVNLSKHEINVGYVYSLLEKWLTFSERLRNSNHTQTLDLADINGRFVYEDNLIQISPSTSQTPKAFQTKNKCQVAKTFNWDEEEVSDDEEVTQVKVLMAVANDELNVGKNHARNDEWIDITMRKGASPSSEVESLTFQTHSPKEIPGLGHNRVICIRGGVLAESFKFSESSIGVKCNTCGSTVHSTTDHNEFDHFKRDCHNTVTTPRPIPFPATTPRAGVFAPFVIIYDSDDEITTLPVRPTPPLPDRTPALYGYPLDSRNDSSDEDLNKTAKSPHTQTASTLVVHPPPTRSLPTSPTFSSQPRKEIPMPLGYRATMNR
nr:retrovirus-related Pol polyprotein from transposon TNT 1-94 [Tanacetum cinerariifolium]